MTATQFTIVLRLTQGWVHYALTQIFKINTIENIVSHGFRFINGVSFCPKTSWLFAISDTYTTPETEWRFSTYEWECMEAACSDDSNDSIILTIYYCLFGPWHQTFCVWHSNSYFCQRRMIRDLGKCTTFFISRPNFCLLFANKNKFEPCFIGITIRLKTHSKFFIMICLVY